MGESFSKKEKKNKKAKAKIEKAQKMLDRKSNNDKGKPLEEMLAFVDENGNLSSVPPRQGNEDVTMQELTAVAKSRHRPVVEATRTGFVSYFNQAKGFGFITDDNARENVFFHANQLTELLKEKDRVSFTREKTPRGFSAVDLKRIG